MENAVFHGLERQLDGGTVQVCVLPEAGDRIRICVEDDGCGIAPEQLEAIRAALNVQGSSKGIGLSNIYQRLKLFYGPDIIFEIDSEQDKGTRITVVIPDHIEEGGNDAYQNGWIVPYEELEQANSGGDAYFQQGKLGMNLTGMWCIKGYSEEEGLNFGITTVPKGMQDAGWPMGSALAISSQSSPERRLKGPNPSGAGS